MESALQRLVPQIAPEALVVLESSSCPHSVLERDWDEPQLPEASGRGLQEVRRALMRRGLSSQGHEERQRALRRRLKALPEAEALRRCGNALRDAGEGVFWPSS